MITLLIATRNAHKVGEIRQILGHGFNYLTLNDFPGAPAVVEDAETFAGNAEKKAVTLANWLQDRSLPHPFYVLADDSGLEVDALNGAPGIYSARFAALDNGGEGNSSDSENNTKLLKLLKDVPLEKRTARFRCVLALTSFDGKSETKITDGVCEGVIALAPLGKEGFGYDPLFIPDGYKQSFSELGEEVKNLVSHRGRALEKLQALFKP